MLEDFIDLGEGYEEDSFVDNSEAVRYISAVKLLFVNSICLGNCLKM